MLDSSVYPLILIPAEITSPYIDGEPMPPVEPSKKDSLHEAINGAVDGVMLSGLVAIPGLIVGAAIVGFSGLTFAAGVTVIGAGVGFLRRGIQAEEYNNTKWPEEYKKYQNLVKIYEKELEDFKVKLPFLRQELRVETIKKTISYDGLSSSARSGIGEGFFFTYLNRYFGENIQTKVTVELYKGYPYTPDFTYIDPETGLHIDIEIDEPYTYISKEPTHWLGDIKEKKRNEHFNSRGWLVIRFAEQQIFEEPEKCCVLLNKIIRQLTDKHYQVQVNNGEPAIVRRWTRDEAVKMAETNFRDSYLRNR